MRKLIVGAQVSLDGVMQAPGGQTEEPTHGFRFGGWSMPYVLVAKLTQTPHGNVSGVCSFATTTSSGATARVSSRKRNAS